MKALRLVLAAGRAAAPFEPEFRSNDADRNNVANQLMSRGSRHPQQRANLVGHGP